MEGSLVAFWGQSHSIFFTLQAMAYLLATAWFLVEAFLIPEGLLKWFYLSFYIHPLILVLCQILLWVRVLISWMRHVLVVLKMLVCSAAGWFVSVLPGGAVGGPEGEVFVDAYGDMSPEEHSLASFGSNNLNMLRVMVVVLSKVIVEEEKSGVAVTGMVIETDEDEDEDAASVCSSTLAPSPVEADDQKNVEWELFYKKDVCMTMVGLDDPVPVSSSRLTPMPSEADDHVATRIEQDPFYGMYEQAMAWFDLLSHERASGISAILQANSEETTHRLSSIWDERAKKRLIRSLESDLELAYVAQTCLSWEILCYQQKKVEDLLENSSTSRASIRFNHIMVEELQKFRVLVQRFTEDERFLSRCRYREYVQARASSKSLLQVPEITEGRRDGEEEEGVELNEVMKAMEKCIWAFHRFVKADDKHDEEIGKSSGSSGCSWWRLSLFQGSCLNLGLSWSWSSHPHPVEDPRDLPLFSNLNSILLQKLMRLRDIRRKKKWWVRNLMDRRSSTRTNPSEDQPHRDEESSSSPLSLLFADIDLALVSRVLHMSTVSSVHLAWCQAKLDNICFSHGKLSKADIFPLFPS
ncbi:hypothetical protein MLD38_001316 [Melastoma candidum]|uniref:Uncharacterized protein n=1 Tax=Melastoma candidum TaxID=119954 RepID=A0ACB9SCT7_9MYRT|nr:hypothetical protein MLD38_001316 [Melastoma candidum]